VAEFRLPDVGEGLTEAEIVSWKVRPGDEVAVNQVLVEIETAKSLVELPSPLAGTVEALLVEEGATVPVGTPLVRVAGAGAPAPPEAGTAPGDDSAAGGGGAAEGARAAQRREPVLVGYGPRPGRRRRRHPSATSARGTAALHGAFDTGREVGVRVAPPEPPHPVSPVPPDDGPVEPLPTVGEFPPEPGVPDLAGEPAAARGRPLAKPPVRRLARDLGVALASVRGTGPGGTITRADVEAQARLGAAGPPRADARPGWDGLPRTERVPVRGVRRATAAAVARSAFTAAHVTQLLTVDVTASMDLLDRLRADRRFAQVRLSPLTLTARAMCLAARRTPEVTAAWDAEAGEIELRRHVDLAVATATPRGLLVPVVRDADALDLVALAAAIADLADRAREGRTTPAETSGGTLAVTNIGVFGVDAGTPIMPPGISAILALGQVARRPWVVRRAGTEVVEPRWVTTLALSFDHRLLDGAQGSAFMTDVAEVLADPALALAFT
jgi:pyruvate dehydrogenase E2 component (dihydrolipoamide acetyltransferase)